MGVGFVFDLCFVCLRSLYVTLRTSPFMVENLGKLHTMSLTAQSITLFYALLLEVQHLSSATTICTGSSGDECKRNISDTVMDHLLTLLQVSVFVLPALLILRDNGCFASAARVFERMLQRARVLLRCKAVATATNQRWPEATVPSSQDHLKVAFSKRRGVTRREASSASATSTRAEAGLSRQPNNIETQVDKIPEELMLMAGTKPVCETRWREDISAGAALVGDDEMLVKRDDDAEALRRGCDNIAVERNKFFAECGELTAILAQSTRSRLSRLAQSTLHDAEHSATPSSLPFTWRRGDAGIALKDCAVEVNTVLQIQTASAGIDTSESSIANDDIQPAVGHSFTPASAINALNDTSALAHSLDVALGDALCSNCCEGPESEGTYWCFDCHKKICAICVMMHSRQATTKSHSISEISTLRAHRELTEKLSRVRETSMEQRRRSKEREEEYVREKQELFDKFQAEEEKRILGLVTEAARIRAEEVKRIRELEEGAARIKSEEEEEARCRKEEEDELLREKRKLDEALLVKDVMSVSSESNTTWANASGFSLHTTAMCTVHSAASKAIDQEASSTVESLADLHVRELEEAQRELGPWFRQIGFSKDNAQNLVHRFSKPNYGVTNCALILSLTDEDVDVILEGYPLGHKRAIKKALNKENKEKE